MPASYAHYRFGAALIPRLPPELRQTVRRFRQLYDVGLHGPDVFLYFSPAFPTAVGKLSKKYHTQSGKVFFERVCRMVRMERSEGAMAYLCGVLAHYALDSLSHPFVNRMAEQGPASHTEIEAEFDRFLLETDGKIPPHTQDFSTHMRLTPGECATAAAFYPGATGANIGKAVRNMAAVTRILTAPEGAPRKLLGTGMKLLGSGKAGLLMGVKPNERCAQLNPSLLRLYEMALDRYMVLLDQLGEYLRVGKALGPEFSGEFG